MRRRLASNVVTPVAGTSFIDGAVDKITWIETELLLERDVTCTLRRNPDNPHDPNAIEVHVDGVMVGHIPAHLAARLAPDLDTGFAWHAAVEWAGGNLHNVGLRLRLTWDQTLDLYDGHHV